MKRPPQAASRRQFLKVAAAAVASPYVISPPAPGRRASAGQRADRHGRHRHRQHGLGRPGRLSRPQRGAVRRRLRRARGRSAKRPGPREQKYGNNDCKAYSDFRELLARERHRRRARGHARPLARIITIAACRSGKDVYCQKPESRTIREGPLMVAGGPAIRPRRLRRQPAGAGRLPPAGHEVLGRRAGHDQGGVRQHRRPVEALQPARPSRSPPDMDWDMWLGPAPWAPYNHDRISGNFSSTAQAGVPGSDYSGGGMTDWGAHKFGRAMFDADVATRARWKSSRPTARSTVAHLPLRQRAADLSQPPGPLRPGRGRHAGREAAAQAHARLQGHRRHLRRLPPLRPEPPAALPRHRAGPSHRHASATWAISPTS